MARRKQELEARLAEVAQHRALFLRPKVYIVDDGEGDSEQDDAEEEEMTEALAGLVE